MLNKLLCWMWGCQPIEIEKFNPLWIGFGSTGYYTVKECKHCGARHE